MLTANFRYIAALFIGYTVLATGLWFIANIKAPIFFIPFIYFYNIDSIFLSIEIIALLIITFTLIYVIPYILNTEKIIGKYGSAKKGKIKDLRKYGLNSKVGFVLGKIGNKFIKIDDNRSAMVIAPSRTGKTAGVIIPTLLTLKNSVIVHDPKGELYRLTSKQRAVFSEVLLYDPFNEHSKDYSITFNVFSDSLLPKGSAQRTYIANISSILIKRSKSDSSGYFTISARNAFVFFAQWMVWDAEKMCTETSLAQIRSKILSNPDQAALIHEMISCQGLPESIIEDGVAVLSAEKGDGQFAGVMGSLVQSLSIFGDERIALATSGKTYFSADTIRKRITSIYFKIRDKDKDFLKPLISLFFEAIVGDLLSKEAKQDDYRVTFILDEFVRIGRLESLKDLPPISAGMNVNAIFVIQDWAQIEDTYGREAISIFDSNTAVKVIFQQNNEETAKRISKVIGNKTDLKTSKNYSNKNVSRSESYEANQLVPAQDIINLDSGKCIILVQGFLQNPLFCEGALWYKDKKFRRMIQNE